MKKNIIQIKIEKEIAKIRSNNKNLYVYIRIRYLDSIHLIIFLI